MSSPLGGFYITARNRKKAADVAEKNRTPLALELSLCFDEKVIYEQQLTVYADEVLESGNDAVKFTVTPALLSETLCHLNIDITGLNDSNLSASQELTVDLSERLTSLVGGSERLKMSVQISKV